MATEMTLNESTLDKVSQLLDRRDLSLDDATILVEVGSTMHGISVGDDDLDLTMIRFEPWTEFVAGNPKRQSMMIRTKPEGYRSFVGDIDLNVYTVRKYAGLLAKGNPSILAVHFAPDWRVGRYSWIEWAKLHSYCASKQVGEAFKGYMRQQLERWQGTRGQKNVNRPELVEKYGYDTKYAGHVIRLGIQGTQYLNHGYIELPMDEADAELIRSVRNGSVSEAVALATATMVEQELVDALQDSVLPERPNMEGVQLWLADTYAFQYGRTTR